MPDSGQLCYVVSLLVSVVFLIYGFILLLKKQQQNEDGTSVIQRQIRGFAFLLLSPIILSLGLSLCYGVQNDFSFLTQYWKQ